MRLLPIAMAVVAVGVLVAALLSGSSAARSPTILVFPMMMLVSLVVSVATGRGRAQRTELDAARADYLGYLSTLRTTVAATVDAQFRSLSRQHPDPDTLWTMIGGRRMWERGTTASEFCWVRVGLGPQLLATPLVVRPTESARHTDPVTANALQRFLKAYSTISGAPVAIPLHGVGSVTIDGDLPQVRALLRAMVCQLAVLHPPDQVLIAGVIAHRNQAHWDWLKWLPHYQHPSVSDAVGSARMMYPSLAEVQTAIARGPLPHVVVIVDGVEHAGAQIPGATTVGVGADRGGVQLALRYGDKVEIPTRPDRMDPAAALACAQRLAAYRQGGADLAGGRDSRSEWAHLIGIDDIAALDPTTLWRQQNHLDRLRVPIGTTHEGTSVELDIKEPAEHGMGPHGLCVGATGSGKSELLRTVAVGMMVRNAPDVLNLLLIDFKGGATFLDLAAAPHVAAVVTNLADEAPLVARMREALAGEMHRRQQLLRDSGNLVSVAAYEHARRSGAELAALPTLFVIVDEFSELLSQHPDFADMFVAIGRLGRSLGIHLLLASQRLDEGRLRGLESHLSYRIGLKMLSASESRTVLGTLDAYELPNTPGAGFLSSGTGELVRFQAAFVSGPFRPASAPAAATLRPAAVQIFTAHATGSVSGGREVAAEKVPASTVLRAVLDRLAGCGPRAHQVWLPPLDASPALETLLAEAHPSPADLIVPIGVVDHPFEQSRVPLTVDLSGAAGNVAVVGAPQAGKSTALCTLIMALAATHDSGQVQFYCLDFGGGALAGLREVPHVGVVASRSEPQLVRRVVAELESIARSRDVIFRNHGIGSISQYRRLRTVRQTISDSDPFGDVFLVVDGWASLRHEFEALEEAITALAVQGLSFGVHVVLSSPRWAEIRPSLRDQIGTRVELRLGDPADSELDRKQAQQVPRDRPGRGLSSVGLHMLVALPRLDGVALGQRRGTPPAPSIPLLPDQIDYHTALQYVDGELGARLLLGVEEHRLQPVTIDFGQQPHLLIFGDNECGKTSALRTLCAEIVRTKTAAQAQFLVVDFRRTLLGAVESKHLDGYAMSPAVLRQLLPVLLDQLSERMPSAEVDHAQLRARSWWSGPDFYVVVDDYDLVATQSGNPLAALLEYLPYARDLGLHLIVARRSGGAARALFEPLLAGLGDFGGMGLIMSGCPDEGALFGSIRATPLPPGRGVLVTRDSEQLVQVMWISPG